MKVITLTHRKANERITYWDVNDITMFAGNITIEFKNSDTQIVKDTMYYDIVIEEE